MQPSEHTSCSLAIEQALEAVSGKWAYPVIGHLSRGALRFNQLKRQLAGISTQSLTDILRHLENRGVVSREVFPTVPVTVEYSLTAQGLELVPVLQALRGWGGKQGAPAPDDREDAGDSGVSGT